MEDNKGTSLTEKYWTKNFGKLPEGWNFTLADNLLSDSNLTSNDKSKFPLYSLTIEDGVTPKTDRYEREFLLKDAENNEYKVVHNGQIVFNPMNLRFGAISLARLQRSVTVSGYYNVLSVRSEQVSPEFLINVLKSPFFIYLYETVATGSLNEKKRVHWSDFKKLQLPLPKEIKEQEKIARILSAWDEAIKLVAKLISLKEKYKASLATKILSGECRLRGGSKPWSKKKLKELGSCVRGLTYSPKNIVNEGLLVLRSSNILNGRIALEDNVYVNIEVQDQYLSKPGDILICVRNGSRNLIGKTALIPKNLPKATHGAFMTVFRTKYSSYVFQLFQTEIYYSQVAKNLGATINSINNSDLLEFSFPFPEDEKEILEIASTLESFDKEISLLRDICFSYQKQKQALMQQLLTGKKRVKV